MGFIRSAALAVVLIIDASAESTAPCTAHRMTRSRPEIKPMGPMVLANSRALDLRGGEEASAGKSLMKAAVSVLTAPLWFFDAVDKEAFILSLPLGFRRQMLRIMFWPTLMWTLLLHKLMPDKRRWYDRVDSRVIIGALPLKRDLSTLSRVERVTGVINFCDEFDGHAE